ncbi:MAG: hypothetical protein E6X43_06075, partial [Peptostreptococcaceae bacterium]|nr:hypothetical protein [Peptostreptococcaceae bacterium]
GYIIEEETDEAVRATASIYIQMLMMKLFYLKERKFVDNEMIKFNFVDEDVIAPKINVMGDDKILNGIDIIECFAKYQEAIFAYIIFGIPFEETMNFENLYEEYYIPFLYFIEQVGNSRLIEFPLVCDLALQLKSISLSKKNTEWENNHPAWRFVKIVEVLKNNPDIPYLDYCNIEKSSKTYIDKIIAVCKFDSMEDMWKTHLKYVHDAELLMCDEMKKAIKLKLEYPWILAYPFYNEGTMKKVYEFHPTAYKFSDVTKYPLSDYDNNLWIMEVIYEYHLQAFVKQICGEISNYCVYRDELQCGFTFYGLKGCTYLDSGDCSGSLNVEEGLQVKCCLDIEKNIADGCSFGIFLATMNIDLKEIDFKDKRDKIDLNYISSKIKV